MAKTTGKNLEKKSEAGATVSPSNVDKGDSTETKIKPWQTAFGRIASIMPIADSPDSIKWAMDNYPSGRTNVFGIVVHHTDGNTAESARKTLANKKESTNIIIDENGLGYVELPIYKNAAACIGYNKWMIQLDVVGRLSKNKPTEPQLKTLCYLIKSLACGRKIVGIDPRLARKTVGATKADAQKLTAERFEPEWKEINARVKKNLHWRGILDDTPFIVTWHGKIRPTECCGKNFIPILEKLISCGFDYKKYSELYLSEEK